MDAATREYIRSELDRLARIRSKRLTCPLPVGTWLQCVECGTNFRKRQYGKAETYCSHACRDIGKGRR